jgi:hypothetical protein
MRIKIFAVLFSRSVPASRFARTIVSRTVLGQSLNTGIFAEKMWNFGFVKPHLIRA